MKDRVFHHLESETFKYNSFILLEFTPLRTPRIRTKISDLETTIFVLNMMVKSGLVFFYFEILLAPSELTANMPGQFSLSGQLFLHRAAATLKGLVEFKNKKN